MSEELIQELQKLNKEDLRIYKDIILKAYDGGSVTAPSNLTDKHYHVNLVRMDILTEPQLRTLKGSQYFESILTTPKGVGIALKLDSERRRHPSLGLGTGPRAPDTIEVLNEEKTKSEEIGEIEEKHPKKCMEGSQ